MKHLLLTTIAFLLTAVTYAQSPIDRDYNEIRTELEQYAFELYDIQDEEYPEELHGLSAHTMGSTYIYFFANNICYQYIVVWDNMSYDTISDLLDSYYEKGDNVWIDKEIDAELTLFYAEDDDSKLVLKTTKIY